MDFKKYMIIGQAMAYIVVLELRECVAIDVRDLEDESEDPAKGEQILQGRRLLLRHAVERTGQRIVNRRPSRGTMLWI